MRKEREGEAICEGERRDHGGARRTGAENEQCRAGETDAGGGGDQVSRGLTRRPGAAETGGESQKDGDGAWDGESKTDRTGQRGRPATRRCALLAPGWGGWVLGHRLPGPAPPACPALAQPLRISGQPSPLLSGEADSTLLGPGQRQCSGFIAVIIINDGRPKEEMREGENIQRGLKVSDPRLRPSPGFQNLTGT